MKMAIFDKVGFGRAGARAAILAICTTALAASALMAQDSSAPPPPPQQGDAARPMGHPGPGRMQEQQLEMMTRELSLTPDQVTLVKGIQTDTHKQMLALRDDTSTAQEDKREKMMAIRKESRGKVRGVLTEEQKTKFDAMEARMKERREEHREGNGAAPPPPPQ